MRISYAFAEVLAFFVIILAKIPNIPNSELIFSIGYWLAVVAIVFCVVRGLPVLLEAKHVIND